MAHLQFIVLILYSTYPGIDLILSNKICKEAEISFHPFLMFLSSTITSLKYARERPLLWQNWDKEKGMNKEVLGKGGMWE